MANRHLDRVLSADYLNGITDWSMEEIRSRRSECQALEDAASYLRRIVQARLDIIGTELHSRATGSDADLEALVGALPTILADRSERTNSGRFIDALGPGEEQATWAVQRADLALVGHDIAEAPELSDDVLHTMADNLHVLEREISTERRTLHDVLDKLQAELVRRYRTGEATVEGLLR
jgi:hypothetical protein